MKRTLVPVPYRGGQRVVASVEHAVFPTEWSFGYIGALVMCEACEGRGGWGNRIDWEWEHECDECGGCGEHQHEWCDESDCVAEAYETLRAKGLITNDMHMKAMAKARGEMAEMSLEELMSLVDRRVA